MLDDTYESVEWFVNFYYCPDCDVEWQDEWSCMCDDECPECGITYTPYESQVIEDESAGFYPVD